MIPSSRSMPQRSSDCHFHRGTRVARLRHEITLGTVLLVTLLFAAAVGRRGPSRPSPRSSTRAILRVRRHVEADPDGCMRPATFPVVGGLPRLGGPGPRSQGKVRGRCLAGVSNSHWGQRLDRAASGVRRIARAPVQLRTSQGAGRGPQSRGCGQALRQPEGLHLWLRLPGPPGGAGRRRARPLPGRQQCCRLLFHGGKRQGGWQHLRELMPPMAASTSVLQPPSNPCFQNCGCSRTRGIPVRANGTGFGPRFRGPTRPYPEPRSRPRNRYFPSPKGEEAVRKELIDGRNRCGHRFGTRNDALQQRLHPPHLAWPLAGKPEAFVALYSGGGRPLDQEGRQSDAHRLERSWTAAKRGT